jgi:putative ABC transport system permease protein
MAGCTAGGASPMNAAMWKIALRTLYRDKGYALINVAGLALAIGCCLILGVYLRSELTYDRHHLNHERIYRVVNEFNINGKKDTFAATSGMLGPMLVEDNADIEASVRFIRGGDERFIRHGDQADYWTNVYTADSNVFEVFSHEILYGDPSTALDDPASVAVSRTFAEAYFGDRDPVGEIISIENGEERRITLVFEDLPANTHLKYNVLFSANQTAFAAPEDLNQRRQRLFNIGVTTYLVMPEDYDVGEFDTVAAEFFERHMKETGDRLNATWRAWVQPLADIHLYSDVPADLPTGNRYYLYGFIAVAVFTLLVAGINYMNLATARAAKRAKEVGMRKILGSSRWALIAQFLAESILLAFIAMLAGVLLVELAVVFTPISDLLGTPISLDFADSPELILLAAGLSLAIGIGAGLYPAFYLSSIMPVSALVGGAKGSPRASRLREALVLVQFTISIAVIACTLLMALQMRYISTVSLGFERENRLTVTLRGVDVIERSDAIRTELLRNSNVLAVSWSASMMGRGFPINVVGLENNDGIIEQSSVLHMGVGPNFLEVMGMQLLEGRAFGEERASEGISAIVVNESLVRGRGWTSVLGKRFEIGPPGPNQQAGTVIGVVKDFNFRSLHNVVEPFAVYRINENFAQVPPPQRPFQQRFLVLSIAGNNVAATMDYIRDTIRQFDAERPFEFEFLDDTMGKLYLSEQRLTTLIGIFAGLCIFIACLGLYGLAAFTTAQRTREIGVRKVFGARTSQIIGLLATRTIVLVLLAAVIASIGSYFAMDAWLAGFAFRTGINPLVFLVAAAAGLAIAYLTVTVQALRAARTHPVHALRYE